MKVTREQKEFKPITIVIETKAEADYFWHLLNVGNPFENYAREGEVRRLGVSDGDLFYEYDEVHNLSEVEE